ncbi:MAG: M43 family zinc metalloprotease [Flavobacteriales bacterium]
MRVLLHSLILWTLGFVPAPTWSQSDEPCSAETLHNAEIEASESYARNFNAVRDAVQRLQAETNRNMEIYNIPVVVHVVHRGSPIGVDENISDAQILSAIDAMNDDFRKAAGTPGDGNGVDTFIQFEMAKRTPNDEPTNGIVRVNGNVVPGYAEHGISNGNDPDAADQRDVKELTTWYGDDYVNIFVVPEINGNDGGWGVQGFAYLGPTGDERDGIVVLYNTFGTVGELKEGRDMNRTVVHEMGHHLSLWHTFSNTDSCTSETNCENQGDEVCDTPPTLENNSGCSLPSCEGAQVENYMDYTPQDCKNMFTEGQRTRMRASLESVRLSLLESFGAVPVTERDLTVSGLSNVGETTCLPSVAPLALVTNYGTHAVNGFELTTTLNNHASFTTIHQETVNPGANVEVLLPELALASDTNDFSVSVKLLGGNADDFEGNDGYSQRVTLGASDYWTMSLTTDTWANEISWRIEDASGETLMDGGGYSLGVATYVEEGCIPVGCHTLIMEDSNGDGICSFDFNGDGICESGGSMTLTNAAGEVLVELDNTNNDFGTLGTWEVCASETSALEGCEDNNSNGICDSAEIAGCQDVFACNFTPGAILDNGSCTYAEAHYDCDGNCLADSDGDGVCDPFDTDGCTDAGACNFTANASEDDGSCEYTSCAGCTDSNGCNYDATATVSIECVYPETYYTCDGECQNDSDGDGICDELEIPGCNDTSACNFESSATDNDGSCEYPAAYYTCEGCINDTDGDGVCDELEIAGCTNPAANNYDPNATDEDGTCTFDTNGCMDASACNYNPVAVVDSGNCIYSEEFYDCDGNCNNDEDADGVCDELEIAGCTDETACNYNEEATDDDGMCEYPAPGEDCEQTSNLGDFDQAPTLNLFPNPLSPEHSMVYLSGLDNHQTPIRVLASDGRVAWQGTGIVTSPGIVGYPIRESIAPGTYFIQVGTSTPSGNIPLMVW